MASQVGRLIYDQNLNVHYNASAGGKTNVSKTLKKGGLGGRKPLGDLSKSVQPTPNQSLKKSFTEKEIGAFKITVDGSKKKSISKASKKPQTGTKKALSDISNLGKPHPCEASKKNLNLKLSVLEEEHLSDVAEEGFLHNHQECIKARKKAMEIDIDDLLITVGLKPDNGFPKQLVSPSLSDLQASSPLRFLELEELAEHGFGDDEWLRKMEEEAAAEFDEWSRKSEEEVAALRMQWYDYDVNFMLKKTP